MNDPRNPVPSPFSAIGDSLFDAQKNSADRRANEDRERRESLEVLKEIRDHLAYLAKRERVREMAGLEGSATES